MTKLHNVKDGQVLLKKLNRIMMNFICLFNRCLDIVFSRSSEMECLFILYVPLSRNGESTVIETIGNIFGDYFKNIQPETLGKYKRNSSVSSSNIARLKGGRLVNVPEPEKDLKLNESLIKQLTEGDTITSRHLHEDKYEFKSEIKIIINSNRLPNISDETIFVRQRIYTIPFDRHFKQEE